MVDNEGQLTSLDTPEDTQPAVAGADSGSGALLGAQNNPLPAVIVGNYLAIGDQLFRIRKTTHGGDLVVRAVKDADIRVNPERRAKTALALFQGSKRQARIALKEAKRLAKAEKEAAAIKAALAAQTSTVEEAQ